MKKKRILLLSEGFGAGHTQAAYALAEGLRQTAPHVHTKVLELGSFLHPTLMPLIFTAYRKTLISSPKLYEKLYRSQYNKTLSKWAELALHRLFYKHTTEIIRQLRPDSIVCTHPFPNAVISRLKRIGLRVPLCTVITDYDVHGSWISTETNSYLVSTEEVKDKLQARGIPRHKIDVTGIPVHPNFWTSHDKTEVRKRFNLREMPTVLIMGGGWGIVSDDELFEYMTSWRDSVQFIFCLGRNEKARIKMLENPAFQHPNIHVIGFTKSIHQLMDISDLLVTKPGGLTCSEALTKGIPMLFYNVIPGQEEENCHYFIDNGFAERMDSKEKVNQWMFELTNHYDQIVHKRTAFMRSTKHRPSDCSRAILKTLI